MGRSRGSGERPPGGIERTSGTQGNEVPGAVTLQPLRRTLRGMRREPRCQEPQSGALGRNPPGRGRRGAGPGWGLGRGPGGRGGAGLALRSRRAAAAHAGLTGLQPAPLPLPGA